MDGEHPTRVDYPYYDDQPVAMMWSDWLVVLSAMTVGFAVLTHAPHAPLEVLGRPLYSILIAALFCAIPLAALYWRSHGKLGALFNGFRLSYVGWGLLFGILNLLFTFVMSFVALQVLDLARNETMAGLAGGGGPPDGALVFYLRTGLQLFGEELLTIVPFLFILWLGVRKLGRTRRSSVALAWIVSALIFGAAHLPTYDWNVIQALLMIGPVRLVLTWAYMKTKSIWTSAIAHVFNDWFMFTATMVLGTVAAAGN